VFFRSEDEGNSPNFLKGRENFVNFQVKGDFSREKRESEKIAFGRLTHYMPAVLKKSIKLCSDSSSQQNTHSVVCL
jgi:hypothetical protein